MCLVSLPTQCPSSRVPRSRCATSAQRMFATCSFYSNLITKNIAMGGDVEKSANSAFTTGSKRNTATADYDMQHGNVEAGAKAKGTDDAEEVNGDLSAKDEGGTPSTDGLDNAPTAKMVDPRAADARRNREASAGHEAEVSIGDGTARAASCSREGKEQVPGVGVNAHENLAGSGDGKGRRREDDERDGGYAKKARQREARPIGDDNEGVGGGDDGTQERTETEELERAQTAATAKAKKEAAIRAARERFLARKKGS